MLGSRDGVRCAASGHDSGVGVDSAVPKDLPSDGHLTALIVAGDARRVSSLLAGIPFEALSRYIPLLDQLRVRYCVKAKVNMSRRAALWVAGAACRSDPAAVALWITAPDLESPNADAISILRVLRDRDAAWQREAAGQIAERQPERPALRASWQVAYGLTVFCAAPPPTADGFVRGWIAQCADTPDKDIRVLLRRHGWSDAPRGRTLVARLRSDPLLAQVLPRIFEVDGLGERMHTERQPAPDSEDCWASALARLAAEGPLERSALLDSCLARLARGERPGHVRAFCRILTALAPTAEECASRSSSYVRVLRDGGPSAAALAQGSLRRADELGLLASDTVLDAAHAALCRSELGVVGGQLTWLDGHARRHPDRAGQLLPVVALALRHESAAIHERAAALIERHAQAAGEDALAQIRTLVRGLDTSVRALVLPHLGIEDAPPPILADAAPSLPSYQPTPMLGPLDSPLAVAEEFRAALDARTADSPHLERLLAAAVAVAWTDREALKDSMSWSAGTASVYYHYPLWPALRQLASVTGGGPISAPVPSSDASPYPDGPNSIPIARVDEIADRLDREPMPCLLAAPTEISGLIDPSALVARMLRYEAAGRAPWPLDFEQALLRLPPDADHDALTAARRLASPAGRILARHLESGTRLLPVAEAVAPPDSDPPPARRKRTVLRAVFRNPAGTVRGMRRSEAAGSGLLTQLLRESTERAPSRRPWDEDAIEHWPAIAPGAPDLIAAHLLRVLAPFPGYCNSFAAQVLPILAASPGPFGAATFAALAPGLAIGWDTARAPSVEAAAILAARGLLDPAQLAVQLVARLDKQGLALANVSISLREIARAGAYEQVWATLAVMLPTVLANEDHVRQAVDLLALTSECAVRLGARGTFPELDAIVKGGGRTRAAIEARRLHRTLTG